MKRDGQLNKIMAVVFLTLICSCVPFVGCAFAQVTVGLNEGDTFIYQVSSNSNTPSIYQIVHEPKKVESIQIQVTQITSHTLRLNITESFKNGTKYSWIQNRNLNSAVGFPIIGANLNVNDRLWSGDETLSPLVSEVATQKFPDGNRDIVYATVPPSAYYNQIDYHFDRMTGLLVEVRFVESNDVSTVLTLAVSNVWVVSASPSPSPVVSASPSPSPVNSASPSSTPSSSSTVIPENPSPTPVTPEFPAGFIVVLLLAIVLLGVITYKTKIKCN